MKFSFPSKVLLLVISFFYSWEAYSLSCQQVRTLTAVYIKTHYSFNSFDDNLSKRTFDGFLKTFDPGKLYFYKQDVETLKKQYELSLDDQIPSLKCSVIDDFIDIFKKRFKERHIYVAKLIKRKYNFKKKESLNFDRKTQTFAKTQEQLNERWRKRVKYQLLELLIADIKLDKAREKIAKRYKILAKRQNEQTIDQIYGFFLNSFANALDPHTTYMSPDVLEDFRIRTNLSLEGIGAVLSSEDGFTIIKKLVPGGAAWKSKKLKVEDKIVAVAQDKGAPEDVIDMDLREVVKRIRGAKGTTVHLSILRETPSQTKRFVVPIVREKIQLQDGLAKSKVIDVEFKTKGKLFKEKVGVLTLPSFYVDFQGMHERRKDYRSSARDTKKQLNDLKKAGVSSIIVDLRNNGGGSLDESIKIAGYFIDKGSVVQVKDTTGQKSDKQDTDKEIVYDGPLVVMINRQSASASEILAGAIQDYQRGLIIGDTHTFGKGTVQNLNNLGPQLGATKITLSKFYRPSGASTQLNGVSSDIVLPSLVEELEIGEKHYDYALEWDKVSASSYKKLNRVSKYLSPLKSASKTRVDSNEDFKEVFKNIKEFKEKEKERNLVSLHIDDHKKEKDDKKGKNDKKEEPEDVEQKDEESLVHDFYLQEAIRISTDYAHMLSGRPMAQNIKIPEVAKMKKKKLVVESTKKPKSQKPKK